MLAAASCCRSKYGASDTLFALGFLDHALGGHLKLIGKIAMRDLVGLLAKRYLWRFREVFNAQGRIPAEDERLGDMINDEGPAK